MAHNASSSSPIPRTGAPDAVILPAPTAWPFVLAFGITMLLAGLVPSASVSILGAILAVVAFVGWFRDVFPSEQHETVPVHADSAVVFTYRHHVERLAGAPEPAACPPPPGTPPA